MRPTLGTRIEGFARGFVPVGLTTVLLLMSVAPTHLPGFVHIAPMIALISVYFWAVTEPDAMGYGSAFFLGLVQDSLTGAPLGVGALALLLARMTVFTQQKFFLGKPFMVTWWAFSLVAMGIGFVRWICVCLYYGTVVDGSSELFSVIFTVAVYPLFAWLFGRVHILFFRES